MNVRSSLVQHERAALVSSRPAPYGQADFAPVESLAALFARRSLVGLRTVADRRATPVLSRAYPRQYRARSVAVVPPVLSGHAEVTRDDAAAVIAAIARGEVPGGLDADAIVAAVGGF